MEREVAVTGVGVLTPIGKNYDEFVQGLRAGVCGISQDDNEQLGVSARLANFDFEDSLNRLSLPESLITRARRVGRRLPIASQTSTIVALQAWSQAFGIGSSYKSDRVSIIIAGSNFNSGYQYKIGELFRNAMVPASYALHFMDTDQVGIISEILEIHGEGFSIGAASASGNMGILQGYRQIKFGLSEACLVVSPIADLSPSELQAFAHTGALGGKKFAQKPDQASRPFDEEREGFIYGQGSACVLLESVEKIRQRGGHPLVKIEGGFQCLDGNRMGNPTLGGEVRAMRKGIEVSGVHLSEINYVNAHATSSVLGDKTEIEALKEVFGENDKPPVINATKGLIGHCLFSASLVEAVATIAQMKEGFVHPNRNLNNSIGRNCNLAGHESQTFSIRYALNNAFAFGGINTAVLFSND